MNICYLIHLLNGVESQFIAGFCSRKPNRAYKAHLHMSDFFFCEIYFGSIFFLSVHMHLIMDLILCIKTLAWLAQVHVCEDEFSLNSCFFNRAAYHWNNLPVMVSSTVLDIYPIKSNLRKYYSLLPFFSICSPFWSRSRSHEQGMPLSGRSHTK